MADVVRPASSLSVVSVTSWADWPTRSPTPGERWERRVEPGTKLIPSFLDEEPYPRSCVRCASAPPDYFWNLSDCSTHILEDTTNLPEAMPEGKFGKLSSPDRRHSSARTATPDEDSLFMSTCASTPSGTRLLLSSCASNDARLLPQTPETVAEQQPRTLSAPSHIGSAERGDRANHLCRSVCDNDQFSATAPAKLSEGSCRELFETRCLDLDAEDAVSVVSRASSDNLDHIPTAVALSMM
jgi:hypothetical protein